MPLKHYDLSRVRTSDLIREITTEPRYPVGVRMLFPFMSRHEWHNRRYQVIREIESRKGLTS